MSSSIYKTQLGEDFRARNYDYSKTNKIHLSRGRPKHSDALERSFCGKPQKFLTRKVDDVTCKTCKKLLRGLRE